MKVGRDRTIECRHCLFRAFDRAAERMIWKVRRVKQLSQQLVRRIFDHLHFFDDDLLLFHQIVFIESRVHHHVGQQIECAWHFGIDYFCRKAGHLMRRVSIELTTQPI